MKKLLLSLSLAGLAASLHAQTIMKEDFETVTIPALPTGWSNVTTGPGHGFISNSGTLNWAIANVPAHTKYICVDNYNDSGNHPATIASPTFSLVGATTPKLGFDWFCFKARLTSGAAQEIAWIEISTNGGTSYTFLDSILASPTTPTYAWGTKFVDLTTYVGQSNCKVRFCYSDRSRRLVGVALDNIEVFSPQANDMALVAVTPLPGDPQNGYKTTGVPFSTLGGTVLNRSTSTITSYDVYYTAAGGTPVVTNITGVSIAPFTTATFNTAAYSGSTVGTKAINMWVAKSGDPVATNDSMNTTVEVVSFMPDKKLVFEEATGTWCGWCVRGIVYMDSLKKVHGDQTSIVAVHNGDPMASFSSVTSAYDALIGTFISGYPSMVIDRTYNADPSAAFSAYSQLSNNFGFADITFTKTLAGGSLSVNTTIKPAVSLSGDYRAILVVTEDSVHGTTSGWEQHNYYNGYAHMVIGSIDFYSQPSTIPAASMYYSHVARLASPSAAGTANLPSAMTAGSTYPVTLSATIPSTMNANRINLIVMLVDGTSGRVLNSQNAYHDLGVTNEVAGINSMVVYPNPASSSANVIFDLKENGNTTISVFDILGRQVYSSTENMTAGKQFVTIPVANLTDGMYNVVVGNTNGNVTSRLTVAK
jgi:hypothetical protein